MDTSHKRSRSLSEPSEAAVLESLINPNFEELARQFPAFGATWRTVESSRKAARGKLSAHITQEFSVALTKALLHVHWGISLTNLPLHHLCPPVPNRYFYVQWIQRTLLPMLHHPDYFEQNCCTALERPATAGLDIGTGAVCIYPLLYCASCPNNDNVVDNNNNNVKMYATDIDPAAVELAQDNVHSNPSLRSKIQLLLVPGSEHQLQQEQQLQDEMDIESNQTARVRKDLSERVDSWLFPVGPLRRSMEHIIPDPTLPLAFSMTNPPFHDIGESASSPARTGDGREGTAMTSNEGSYPGGEVGFCLDMIVDGFYFFLQQQRSSSTETNSKVVRGPPGWSSSMCGKKASLVLLQHVVTQLLGPAHVCATEFGPGQMTRWFLAWTFQRPVIRSPLAKLPGWTFDISLPLNTTCAEADGPCQDVVNRIQEYCRTTSDLEVTCEVAFNDANKQRLEIREASIMAQSWKEDQALPERIKIILHQQDAAVRMDFLPVEGHFLMDVTVFATPETSAVQVRAEAYQHSVYGKKVIEKIKSQLESEVCRTNRKWRRQLQRQQQQESAMDESR